MIGLSSAASVGFLAEPLDLAHRHVDREIDLAGLHRGDARRRILDDLEGDALDLRLRPPIAVVALQHDARIELVVDQLVGPGADRLLAAASTPTDSKYFFGTMKLPRKASHCGAVGAGELNFIIALVGDCTSMSVTLRQEFAVSTLWPALMRSKKV